MAMIRLDKLLGHSGCGSRRDIKELCRSGVVTVDGRLCTDSSVRIDGESSVVTVRGQAITYAQFHYLMLHKPAGLLSATTDRFSRTVLDLLPPAYGGAGLFPVGRLDKDTTGLLLLTNDGTWAHRITSPKKHISKIYEALVKGEIPADIDRVFQAGLTLEDGLVCLPARAEALGPQKLRICVQEGKFHQVKRMCAAVGLDVRALHRSCIGALSLDPSLQPGAFRVLSGEERELPFL